MKFNLSRSPRSRSRASGGPTPTPRTRAAHHLLPPQWHLRHPAGVGGEAPRQQASRPTQGLHGRARQALIAALPLIALTGCSSSDPAPAETDSSTASSTTASPDSTSSPTGPASSGESTSDATSTTAPDVPEASTSTGQSGCNIDADCPSEFEPFCRGGSGQCAACSELEESDIRCEQADPNRPLCVGDTCVQCSAQDASACEGTTPVCGTQQNTCVGCSFHEQCQDLGLPACNIVTGACFSNGAVTMVNAETSEALQNAVTAVPVGSEHAIIVTGSGATNHSITVDGGKTIAFVSASDSPTVTQEVRGASGSPTLTVTGAGTTVYLHRLELTANGDDVGISVESSGTLYADAVRVAQNSGGGIQLASGTTGFLRNSMIGGEGGDPGLPAVSATAATLEVLYSTLALEFNSGGPAFECTGGTVTVRNSVIVSDSNIPDSAAQCPGSTVTSSLVGNNIAADSWFVDITAGDYALTPAGQPQFNNTAQWQPGDPPFDFDGDLRPTNEGEPDYAGADVP